MPARDTIAVALNPASGRCGLSFLGSSLGQSGGRREFVPCAIEREVISPAGGLGVGARRRRAPAAQGRRSPHARPRAVRRRYPASRACRTSRSCAAAAHAHDPRHSYSGALSRCMCSRLPISCRRQADPRGLRLGRASSPPTSRVLATGKVRQVGELVAMRGADARRGRGHRGRRRARSTRSCLPSTTCSRRASRARRWCMSTGATTSSWKPLRGSMIVAALSTRRSR